MQIDRVENSGAGAAPLRFPAGGAAPTPGQHALCTGARLTGRHTADDGPSPPVAECAPALALRADACRGCYKRPLGELGRPPPDQNALSWRGGVQGI